MRALNHHRAGRYAQRLALVLCGAAAAVLSVGFPATVQAGSVNKGLSGYIASAHCKPQFTEVPCRPIQTSYSFGGLGVGDLGSIWAKLGPIKVVEQSVHGQEVIEINERSYTWHSRPNVVIEAVYALTLKRNSDKYSVRKLPSGSHSGHAVLRSVLNSLHSTGAADPILLLQGRHE